MPLVLYLPERRVPADLSDFLAFLGSDAAAAVLARAGVVQPGLTPVSSDLASRVLRALATEADLDPLRAVAQSLAGAVQLGVSLRPDATDRAMRALSTASLAALAGVESGQFVLAAHGPSRAQAEADAGQVLVELAALRGDRAPLEITVLAVGDALPVACADGPWAGMNRRVDVWRVPVTDSPRRGN
jgi:hypothetical protein